MTLVVGELDSVLTRGDSDLDKAERELDSAHIVRATDCGRPMPGGEAQLCGDARGLECFTEAPRVLQVDRSITRHPRLTRFRQVRVRLRPRIDEETEDGVEVRLGRAEHADTVASLDAKSLNAILVHRRASFGQVPAQAAMSDRLIERREPLESLGPIRDATREVQVEPLVPCAESDRVFRTQAFGEVLAHECVRVAYTDRSRRACFARRAQLTPRASAIRLGEIETAHGLHMVRDSL